MSEKPILLWFRHDLRLSDNRALKAALATQQPVIALYVLDDEAPGAWAMGAASRWWLHMSLTSLAAALEKTGNTLVLRRGHALSAVAQAAAESGADAVYCSRSYQPWAAQLEGSLNTVLTTSGVAFKRFAGSLLVEPEQIETQAGGPFKVYTPFWRSLSSRGAPAAPVAAPARIPRSRDLLKSERLEDWSLLPQRPDWAHGFRNTWRPGEAGARARLAEFLDTNLATYAGLRNRPDLPATSRLSPHLAFGEISPGTIWYAAAAAGARDGTSDQGRETFLKELVWREFSAHLLFHFPTLPELPFRPEFAAFPWRQDAARLRDWQRGRTGYPIVDAGMRELWATGWMHNRVRMVVASFLIKDLMIHWREGEAWFWDTLVDADLANNAASWQWVAGSGADAAPYFRIFNPVTQGQKFDPEGAYVRRWVPELAKLPASLIHAPWHADPLSLAKAGVRLGIDYPHPIVDHGEARVVALAGLASIKT